MGNSKKFYRKKQRNNKASKSRKKTQRNKKYKAAATSASVSEEKTNYDRHDLETLVALVDSIADTYANSKGGGLHVLNSSHDFERCAPLGITNSPGVFVPKMETHTGYDDQIPPATMCRDKKMGNSNEFYWKKQRNNKASKSRKKRQRNKKYKAAATSASVSEENENYDSHDLETLVALMDSIADTYGNSKCGGLHVLNSSHDFESCAPLGITNSPGVFVPIMETHTGYDDQTPPATMCRDKKMGNSNEFYWKKQRNKKASKSRKKRQRNKKNKAAATSASVSEEKTNYDGHDLETLVALMDSIADTYANSKCGCLHVLNSHDFESCAPLGITNGPGVLIPKMETHTGYDDQIRATMFKAAHNFEISAPVGIPNSPGDYIPKIDAHTVYDDQTPATMSCYGHDWVTMDTSGVSVIHTPEINGPPVKNSAGNLENWVGIPGVFIPKRETRAGYDDQTAPATVSSYSHGWETMDTSGVSVIHTHKFPEYNGPPVKNSAGNLENWVGIPGVFIPKRETRAGYDDQTAPATVSSYSHGWETMDTSGVSVIHTYKFPEYNGPPVKNSAGNLENWVGIPGVYLPKRETCAGCDAQTAPATVCMQSNTLLV